MNDDWLVGHVRGLNGLIGWLVDWLSVHTRWIRSWSEEISWSRQNLYVNRSCCLLSESAAVVSVSSTTSRTCKVCHRLVDRLIVRLADPCTDWLMHLHHESWCRTIGLHDDESFLIESCEIVKQICCELSGLNCRRPDSKCNVFSTQLTAFFLIGIGFSACCEFAMRPGDLFDMKQDNKDKQEQEHCMMQKKKVLLFS